jgi:uncharacterized protein (TIGR03437 family)
MIANGKVYAGTENRLAVYGLLPQGSVTFSVASSASATPGWIAPGAMATLYGNGLAGSTATASALPLPSSLGGASITVNGVTAPLLYASSTQINFQVPFEISPGAATITLSINESVVGSATVPLYAGAPGVFIEPGGNAAAVNQDGSINSAAQPAPVGTVVSVYVTGLGAVNPGVAAGTAAPVSPLSSASGVTATVGGVPAVVEFAGLAPTFAGLYQVNVQIPQIASGQYNVAVSVQGVGSNPGLIAVQ